jgi:hypothetical protein
MEEVQGVLKDPGVEVVQERDGVHGDVDGVHGEVEIVDDDVEVTQGQVQELEDEFERVHTNIQDVFQRVDRATNVGATEARISATPRYIRTTNLAQDVDSSGFIRTYSNPSSTCEVCIHPALCLKCGVRSEPSIFLCLGCRLPVPTDLRSCESCGNPCLCDNFWCKDCATTVAINKEGVCIRCRRSPSIYLENEKKAHDVPDSQV